MGAKLEEIAQQLKDSGKKVQLIYAFNGTGKTRLSREFVKLVSPKFDDVDGIDDIEDIDAVRQTREKILYYNAFTEDLFYWDNGRTGDAEPKLKIQPNSFTDWVLRDQGLDRRVIDVFQNLTGSKTEPVFDLAQGSIHFIRPETLPQQLPITFGGRSEDIKISKGEESNFIWSIFYTLLDQVISTLNNHESDERDTNQFDQLEYVFIDDPVSSLDENHLIELAVNLADLIKASDYTNGNGLRFVITTHSPLFYNVLHNELGLKAARKKEGCYLLEQLEDGMFNLDVKYGDSNRSFSYHLYLRKTLEQAIAENKIQKYHFTLLRNLYEKTASFLGYEKWQDLLETAPGDKDAYLKRIITFSSHRTLSSDEVAEPTSQEKQTVAFLLNHLLTEYSYYQQEEQHG